jgi:subtilase family serine protease
MHPDYTSSKGNHYLAPNDLATIYNMSALHAAGFDGTGQKLVIAGQTQIDVTDIQQFRAKFNLPANDPQITLIPGSRNPGTLSGDLAEADLDIEWSGAVARNATILYVYATNVMDAVQYSIDQNLAPVVSTSYGLCELETLQSDAAAMRSWAQQGNAQGITWFSASGDSGAADCNDSRNPGLSVDLPGAIPEVTSVGGTTFAEGTGNFWNATTDANGASVLSYIPEVAWNDSAADGSPSSTGGGASTYYTKPSWQIGSGVPGDNARHVPDVSMSASADHDGYLVYTGGSLSVYGGTSVPTPAFAGLAALLNHYLTAKGVIPSAGLGNINPHLYALAQASPSIFHDVTGGDNIVTVACGRRQLTCNNTAVGFAAGPGYDQATGLGSVDAYLLATGWSAAVSPKTDATLTLLSNVHSLGANDTVYLTATVTGATTPAGSVIFSVSGVQIGSATLTGSSGTATATLAVKGSQIANGTVTATFNDATAAVTLSLAATNSNPPAPFHCHSRSKASKFSSTESLRRSITSRPDS